MRYNKAQIILVLFTVLAALYAVNISYTKKLANTLIESPAKLSFTIVEPPKDDCENCYDANEIIKMIDNSHNIKYKTNSLPYGGTLSQKFIEMYDIKNLPAIVVSGDISSAQVAPAWKAMAGEEKNDRIIMENLLPYYDLESGSEKGVISVVLLKDEKCASCFDANEYTNILKRFGLFVKETVIYDVASAEGKELVGKYSVKKVPTMILSPDAKDYKKFADSWGEVGTISEDGRFILREVQKVSPQYKNI